MRKSGVEMQLTGVAHVAITVTDLQRSKEWYARVLDWSPVLEGSGEDVTFAVGTVPGATLVGLREYQGSGKEPFDPRRTGMDHLAFQAPSRHALTEWESRFTDLGVEFDETQDTPHGHVLNFKDPDGIALEIYAAPSATGQS
jgi:glyoxylase I family protein